MKNDYLLKTTIYLIGIILSFGSFYITSSFAEIKDTQKESFREIKKELKDITAIKSNLIERVTRQEERCRNVC
jgi:hypothetical protein